MGYKKQNGFTLVELLVIIGILGFLSAAIAMTFSVVTRTSTMAMGQTRALSQVNQAGSWISRDVENAVASTVQPTTGNILCSMQSSVWNGSTFGAENITYMINNGVLTRTSQLGINPANTINVAQFIEGPSADTTYFSSENTTNKYFVLTVKANYNNSVFTRVYKMKQVLTQ